MTLKNFTTSTLSPCDYHLHTSLTALTSRVDGEASGEIASHMILCLMTAIEMKSEILYNHMIIHLMAVLLGCQSQLSLSLNEDYLYGYKSIYVWKDLCIVFAKSNWQIISLEWKI